MAAPAVTEWLDDLRLEPGPPFVTMGTRALDLDGWLVVDEDRSADLAYKADLLASVPALVVAIDDVHVDTRPAGREVLGLVTEWLAGHGVRDSDAVCANVDEHEHPLITAARLVQEDLVVLHRIDGLWVLTAGVVCFPSHWTVADKVGLPLEGIHAPVAHYQHELRDKVDRFHDRLTVDRPVWRRNWFVNSTSELHLPAHGQDLHGVTTIEPDGAPMWIRSEYQTLRRLAGTHAGTDAGTDAILFTIRVQRAPLGVLRGRPDLAANMLAATRSWDRAKRMYTSTGGALDALMEWLSMVAEASDR